MSIGIVHDRSVLISLDFLGLMLKLKRPVGQLAKSVVEKFINRSSIDHLAIRNFLLNLPVIDIEKNFYIPMIEHVFKHAREPMQRHGLVRIAEIPLITIGAHRHPRYNGRIQFRRVKAPLLPCVIFEELFVELAPDSAHHHILGITDHLFGLRHRGKNCSSSQEVRLRPRSRWRL